MSAAGETRWGWHQLADDCARRLVASAGITGGHLVLDVGAGTGAITTHLVRAGARVIAIELHPHRAATLRDRFADTSVKVVRADASDLWLPRSPFRVVANPPFGITTSLLRRLLHRRSALVRADLVVPVHAGRRWAGGRGAGSDGFTVRLGRSLPPWSFSPPGPPSVVLVIERSSSR